MRPLDSSISNARPFLAGFFRRKRTRAKAIDAHVVLSPVNGQVPRHMYDASLQCVVLHGTGGANPFIRIRVRTTTPYIEPIITIDPGARRLTR